MATTIFLDAVVVRSLLLPAVLELFGRRRTWTFPSWLERRLPRLAIEPATEPVPALEEAARCNAVRGVVFPRPSASRISRPV